KMSQYSVYICLGFFFFSSRRRHTISKRDWSSDVCSSDLFYFEKTRYSAFTGTNLELKLRERQIEELYLVGVCTDICILHTAIDAYNKGFKIVIPENCVASFDQGAHEWALSHFKNIL